MHADTGRARRSLGDIDPTVFIGLGGAGGQVLARVRRIFTEEFGRELDSNGASPLQFLLLDTDDFDKLSDDVRKSLPDRNRDFLSLSHFNPARYATRQLAIPGSDLRRWFDPRALRYLEDGMIRDGASRQRMLGRLCLHYSFRDVEQRIRGKLDAAADAGVVARSGRVRPEPRPLHVFVVASSCGGTGSASFLDIACLVHRIARDRGTTPSVTGFLFLPFPYIEANADLDPALESFYQHNAWAFFEELNHLLLHPERVPEFVLDLDRPDGHPPRPFDYGRELFRTIYLLNDRIPQVGRMDFPQMYAYAARGIFDLFLAPEEGAVQSHYSNIKDKLKEPDRIHGLVKRFATFGYAEFRLQEDVLPRRLAETAVTEVWKQLAGTDEDAPAVEREAGALDALVAAEVQSVLQDARKWLPSLEGGAELVRRGRDRLRGSLSTMMDDVQRQLDRRLKALPDAATLQASLWERIARALDHRLQWPPLGVRGEQAVLRRFRAALLARAEGLVPPGETSIDPLQVDAALVRTQQELGDALDRLNKKREGMLSFRAAPDAVKPDAFASELDEFIQQLRTGAHRRQDAEVSARLARALREVVADGGPLDQRIGALDVLVDALRRAEERDPAGSGAESVPTAREFPSAEEVKNAVEGRKRRVWTDVLPAVEVAQRHLWSAFANVSSRDSRVDAGAFRRELVELWAAEIQKDPDLGSVRQVRDPLVLGEGCGDAGYLRDLLAMSSPACPIDRTRLHHLDSIPRIPSVIWPWEFEGKEKDVRGCLGITDEVAVSPAGDRRRVAVLQAWYGFTSRALEGMDTLRRSYLARDREISLPHIHAGWNDRGVGCTGDALAVLSDPDLLHVARILALSHAAAAPGTGSAFPELDLVPDGRDGTSSTALLRYEHDGCALALTWRRLRPRPGHHRWWDIEYAAHAGVGACNGAAGGKVSPAGVDLALDLAAYLASDARAEHARLLDEITCLERIGETPTTWYAAAYAAYLTKLNAWIEEERGRRRDRHLPLMSRLSDALYRYLHRTDNHEGRSL